MPKGQRTTSSPDVMSGLLLAIRGQVPQGRAAELANEHLSPEHTINQARLSRAETGRTPLTPEQAEGLARGLQATAQQRRQLIDLAKEFKAKRAVGRPTLIRQPYLIQQRIGKLEAASTLIRSWQPEVVIGMLQTPEWTRAAFGALDERWWDNRRVRLAQLDDSRRSWHFLMSEAVLRWNIGDDVMAGQLDYLTEISHRENVQLGIVPLGTVKVFPAPSGFHLYGRRAAEVSAHGGSFIVDAAAEVAKLEDTFAQLADAAVYYDEARRLIATIRTEYR